MLFGHEHTFSGKTLRPLIVLTFYAYAIRADEIKCFNALYFCVENVRAFKMGYPVFFILALWPQSNNPSSELSLLHAVFV